MKYGKGFFMKKYITMGLAAALSAVLVFAQTEAADDSQIELPDLTTVVTGGADTQDYAPPPSFEDVLDIPYDSGDVVPVLPSASASDESDLIAAGTQASQKDIYAEGKIGGGYPASFTGDFEIARLYGADPFKISFTHNSNAGFAGHNLADGYKEGKTAIALEKDFIRRNLRWGIAGRYEDTVNGFQSKVTDICANNQDAAMLSGNLLWSLPKDFYLGFDIDSQFYFRFADITQSSNAGFEAPDSLSRVTADPKLTFSWIHNGFEISLDSLYNLEAWDKASNRGEFNLNFAWGNDKIKLMAAAGIVVGNTIGDNAVIPPFSVGLETALPVYFSDRKLNLSLRGGLESYRKTTSELEYAYKFSGTEELTGETSDWFGRLNLLVPLKASFTGKIAAGYAATAFGNGVWTPDYTKDNLVNGLYGFSSKGRSELYTDFAFTWKYKIFAASAEYHANWMDIPVLENKHKIAVNFALQSQKGLWGVNLDTAYLLDAEDNKPIINLEGYVQATSSVRIVLSVSDMLKFLGAEERLYAGQYAANSGNATVLVKFLF